MEITGNKWRGGARGKGRNQEVPLVFRAKEGCRKDRRGTVWSRLNVNVNVKTPRLSEGCAGRAINSKYIGDAKREVDRVGSQSGNSSITIMTRVPSHGLTVSTSPRSKPKCTPSKCNHHRTTPCHGRSSVEPVDWDRSEVTLRSLLVFDTIHWRFLSRGIV